MEKHQKVFFYTNLVPKARLMENLGLTMRKELTDNNSLRKNRQTLKIIDGNWLNNK